MLFMSRCRQFRVDLALLAGGDLARPREVQVLRHVTTCPGCRRYWQSAQDGQKLLEQLRSSVDERGAQAGSLWPQIRSRMLAMHQPAEPADWRGWLPVGALAAACLTTILIMTDSTPPGQMETGWANPILDVQPVARPLWPMTPVGRSAWPQDAGFGAGFEQRPRPSADDGAAAPMRQMPAEPRLPRGM